MTAAKKLTANQTAIAFGVTSQTIYLWRRGQGNKTKLVFDFENPEAIKSRVSLPVSRAKAWAQKNGIGFAVDPDIVLATVEARTTPGPKAGRQAAGGADKRVAPG